jgi:chaperonin GroES
MELTKILELENIAGELDQDLQNRIGSDVVESYSVDRESRREWEKKSEEWLKLALQITEHKSFPWPGSANIKYPLLTIASLQFAARAYPAIVNGYDVVKGVTIGFDPDGSKTNKAVRIGKHMSYQLMHEMENWDEEMDKLCLALPIIGCIFKKTYHNPLTASNVSELVYPKQLVVNYYAKSLSTASRITHIIEMYPNEVIERQRANIFLDVDLIKPSPGAENIHETTNKTSGLSTPTNDDDAPYILLEQHCWLDIDEDGYKEPYIATVDLTSGRLLRLIKRFDEEDVEYSDNGELRKIHAQNYFTKFSFIPNPDGGFYDVGFGILLGPINETVNTILNQLIDAGTLSNMQGGFLGRGVRLKAGDMSFRLGEWKTVNATGDDLRKSILPMPTKDPSPVLFQLLGMLNEVGKELSSVSEIMTGKMPGQNTPATTTMTAVEQGLKVFTAIHKRIYRSLTKEFKLLYRLNSKYLADDVEFTILGTQTGATAYQNDYKDGKIDVLPAADPNVATEAQKLAKAQGLLELLQSGLINPQVVIKRVLEAQNQPGIEELLQVPEKGPSPDEMEMQLKAKEFEWKQQKEQMELQLQSTNSEFDNQLKQSNATLNMAKAQLEAQGQQLQLLQMQLDSFMNQHEVEQSREQAAHQQAMDLMGHEQANKQMEQQAQQQAQQGETSVNE